ncbi:MAG: hypothetical protein Q9182_007083 [Xanthomendoza sp. 2 TL-2023]
MSLLPLDYIFYHVFLPAQLPQGSDTQDGKGDQALLEVLLETIDTFRTANDHIYYQQWSTVQRSIRTFARLHSKSKSLSRGTLKAAFQAAAQGETIILHIALQNSALIVRQEKNGYVVETFEVSPRAADVLAAQRALEWDFPSRAVLIPPDTFEDEAFQDSLASFLEKASLESVKQYAATTLKAGSNAYESRDTSFPAIIGQLLITILEVPGHRHTPTLTRKHIRDEVCWGDGAENPWRRSPTWLVLRVSIQRMLCSLIGSYGIFHYKFFMCSLMSFLCQTFGSHESFPSDQLQFARTKLARRVAKLEAQSNVSNSEVSTVIQSLFNRTGKTLEDTLRILNKNLEDRGTQIRLCHTKKVFRLPRRADENSTVLSLRHSLSTVNDILEETWYGGPRAQVALPNSQPRLVRYFTWVNAHPKNHLSTTDYHCLAELEVRLAEEIKEALNPSEDIDLSGTVLKLRQRLQFYHSRAIIAYKDNPEQLSLMLLTLMEIWMGIDSLVVRIYPLMKDYDHGFPLDLMYPLKVSKLSDMFRLTRMEGYLRARKTNAKYPLPNVLGEPTNLCFAVRYFDECKEMQALLSIIWQANDEAKADKAHELNEGNERYENLIRKASETACSCKEDEHRCDDPRCRKGYLEREASRMRIPIHEDLLPDDDILAKSIVFELLLPSAFAAWRDSVWQLLMLARGEHIPDQKPMLLLREYPGLEYYAQTSNASITLASKRKSFRQAHYSKIPLPASLEKVYLPHALKSKMFDSKGGLWTSSHLDKPSFAAICSAVLPPRSAWISLKRYIHPTFHDVRPSTNEIVASQTRCPNSLTIAEYSSFQDLRVGTMIQWVKLLRELASPNINFGSAEVNILVTELALGAGPAEDGHFLRATHWVFGDRSFCQTLAECIRVRLQAIATNWREGQTVECLSVLVQRPWCLGQDKDTINEARELILLVRSITYIWIKSLRCEISNAFDVDTAQKRSRESLHAALLCRKTYMLEAARANGDFQHAAFACFLECAFTIKDNLSLNESSYISNMPASLRSLFVSDLQLIHSLESQVRGSVQSLQSAVSEAVNNVWMGAEGASARRFSTWTMLSAPQDSWCEAHSLSGDGIAQQLIHFNIMDGTLYIDGRLLGRLPEEFAQQDFFQQFFGNRVFLTRPSFLQGMSYMFVSPFEEHEIHFGFRKGYRFMRVRPLSSSNTILEYLPASTFTSGSEPPDLPLPLIQGCVHWLNLQTRIVEVRPMSAMWRSKYSNWKINMVTRQGLRRNTTLLLDPQSLLFRHIYLLIEPFEDRKQMIVYQPLDPKSNLVLDLPGLELKFQVNSKGFFESRQLRAYIDEDQDAGTLYGLESSLVIRDSVLQENRSILVAMGPAIIKRHKAHLKVTISHNGFYARFSINKLLRRLECAAEPRLLYFKAYCDAITSSPHPDPLTARTGTEEALNCLRAANAQPWAPLDSESYRILFLIADLTPPRLYYPEGLRVLQNVHWNDDMMSTSQSGEFKPLVEEILQQCAVLHRFHLDDSSTGPVYKSRGDAHLHRRALLRARDFQPALKDPPHTPSVQVHYEARDSARMVGCRYAYEAASLVWAWSLNIPTTRDLAARLQDWPLIQGFVYSFETHLLSSLIDIEPASNWGSLFRLCQQVQDDQEKAKLMFLFGTMAFGGQIDITLIRILIAIAIMEDSKILRLPQCTEFIGFRWNQIPTVEFLAQYIRPHRVPYPDDERAFLGPGITLHRTLLRKLEAKQRKHELVGEVQ